jgi:hypothetical protein
VDGGLCVGLEGPMGHAVEVPSRPWVKGLEPAGVWTGAERSRHLY